MLDFCSSASSEPAFLAFAFVVIGSILRSVALGRERNKVHLPSDEVNLRPRLGAHDLACTLS